MQQEKKHTKRVCDFTDSTCENQHKYLIYLIIERKENLNKLLTFQQCESIAKNLPLLLIPDLYVFMGKFLETLKERII